MIQTIIFDLSEVLIAGLVGIERPISAILRIPETEVFARLGGPSLHQLFCGRLVEDGYLAWLVEHNRWAIPTDDLKRILRTNFRRTVAGMPRLLGQLAPRYELALLSDHAREWIAYIESVHRFLGRFHARFYSYQLGQTKQEPSTFRMVLERLKREASQCLFIDDSEANVQVARSVGISAMRFTTPQSLMVGLDALGVNAVHAPTRLWTAADPAVGI
jgi:2-haloacid dehalogenase